MIDISDIDLPGQYAWRVVVSRGRLDAEMHRLGPETDEIRVLSTGASLVNSSMPPGSDRMLARGCPDPFKLQFETRNSGLRLAQMTLGSTDAKRTAKESHSTWYFKGNSCRILYWPDSGTSARRAVYFRRPRSSVTRDLRVHLAPNLRRVLCKYNVCRREAGLILDY